MPGPEEIFRYLLILSRCLAFYAASPFFTFFRLPLQVVVVAGIATTLSLGTTQGWGVDVPVDSLPQMVLLVVREVLLGGLLALVSAVVFAGIRFGGQLIGVQMGFSMANVIDPAGSGEVPLIGRFQELLAVTVFLAANGHHLLLQGLSYSFDAVPPGGFPALASLPALLVPLGASVFFVAIQVGAPVIGALFLTDTALGFVARAVPQMNVFLVGLPVKILVGMFFLVVTAPLFGALLTNYSSRMVGQMVAILAGM